MGNYPKAFAVGFGIVGLGYALMVTTVPTEEQLYQVRLGFLDNTINANERSEQPPMLRMRRDCMETKLTPCIFF